jgi:hypothetical protein
VAGFSQKPYSLDPEKATFRRLAGWKRQLFCVVVSFPSDADACFAQAEGVSCPAVFAGKR